MNAGKLSESVLKRSVLKKISYKDKSVISGGKVGNDAAVIDVAEKCMITATDTLVAKQGLMFGRPLIRAVNNVAATGGIPKYCQISIVIPEGMREIKLKLIMEELSNLACEYRMQITGGHTCVSEYVTKPVVTATVWGIPVNRPVCDQKNHIKPGQSIVMTKSAGIEGTAVLAAERQEELLKRFTDLYIQKGVECAKDMSVLKEAVVASKYGVSAMHDMSSGGIFGALWELGEAGNCGMQVDLKKINIRQETIELTNYFNINPYVMPSAGSLLMVTADCQGLISALRRENIDAYIIGSITDGNDRIVINEEEVRYLEPPKNK